MQLRQVRVRDFRSVFADDLGAELTLDLGEGMNTLVGRNNCGKSNVARAIALALDPQAPFDPATDVPGPRPTSYPAVALTFDASEDSAEEDVLLDAALAYEQAVDPTGPWHASSQRVVLEVRLLPAEGSGHRRLETLLTPSGARPTAIEHEAMLALAVERLRAAVRFVLISSGESLQSVLEGNFREILQSVIREQLSDHYERAEEARLEYIHGLQDDLLAPLRDRLRTVVQELFPEIDGVTLAPEVSQVDATLSHVGVTLHDVVDTPLTLKGTGVRGGVLVAMLRYLADNATRGMVFALEEPEAFLHPAAQEDMRDALERLADRSDVSVLVTTHSPFVISRSPRGRVFGLTKDRQGRTRVTSSAAGDEPHAPLVGELFREVTFEELLRRATELPEGKRAVLLVEGWGDLQYLELVCERVGRPDLIADLHIQPAGGCRKIVAQAVVARAASEELPVGVLVDNDEFGRQARNDLKSKFDFQPGKDLFSYADVFPKDERGYDYEAEDLFPPEIIASFVTEHGSGIIEGSWKRPDGHFHYDLDVGGKELLLAHLSAVVKPHHCERWVALLAHIRTGLGLGVPEAGDAPGTDADGNGGRGVLVVADRAEHARYLRDFAVLLAPDRPLDPSVTHLAFYAEGEVKREVPRIRAQYGSLRCSPETVTQLRAAGTPNDQRVADLVEAWLAEEAVVAGSVHQLLLLSSTDAADALELPREIRNTKTTSGGKPMAWVVLQKLVPFDALAAAPPTTDELDLLIALSEGEAN